MTIHVDKLIDYGVYYGPYGPEWCHLTTDGTEELHAFAAKFGMRQEWFQGPPKHTIGWHYDLTRELRAKAVQLGAIEVDTLDWVPKLFVLQQHQREEQMRQQQLEHREQLE